MAEVWKDIEGYEGYYHISNHGRVKSLSRKIKTYGGRYYFSREIIMSQKKTRGYKSVTLNANGEKRTLQVHRLVLEHFSPKQGSETLQVNHINCDKADNNLLNLEWVTPSENMEHASRHGLLPKQYGHHNPNSKLTKLDVLKVIKLREAGLTHREISEMFNVDRKTIGNVLSGKSWSKVTNIGKCND